MKKKNVARVQAVHVRESEVVGNKGPDSVAGITRDAWRRAHQMHWGDGPIRFVIDDSASAKPAYCSTAEPGYVAGYRI